MTGIIASVMPMVVFSFNSPVGSSTLRIASATGPGYGSSRYARSWPSFVTSSNSGRNGSDVSVLFQTW